MKNIKKLLLIIFLTLQIGTTFSQTTDSLSVSPNPFANSTVIHFDIVKSDTITLRVFNAVEQIVSTFFQSTILPSGSYNINLLGDSLELGMYIIRLDIGTTKFIAKKAVKTSSASSIAQNRSFEKILIYPNPTNDQITIPLDGRKTVIVTDLNGKTIKSFTTDEQIISLLDISSGHYIITILTNENNIISTQKIIKLPYGIN
ncbi:MAG: T9SS type A sorting domain-containing protein [Bacteroidota bacterium]